MLLSPSGEMDMHSLSVYIDENVATTYVIIEHGANEMISFPA